MKSKNLSALSDEALIKAHLQAVDDDAVKALLNSTEPGRFMLEADADRRAALAARGIELWLSGKSIDPGKVTSSLLRTHHSDWTAARLVNVVKAATVLNREHEQFAGFDWFPYKPLISALENVAADAPIPPELRTALEQWKAALMPRPLTPKEEREMGEAERVALGDDRDVPWARQSAAFATMERLERLRTAKAEERKLIERLSRLLAMREKGQNVDDAPVVRIDTTDTVGIRMAEDVAKGGPASGREWAALLSHARSLTTTTPSTKWLTTTAEYVAKIKASVFGACISDWFNEAGKPAPQKLVSHRGIADPTLLNDCSVELLKGLAWVVVAVRRSDLAPALGNLADACYRKVRNVGPRNVKVGNAAVAALAALESPEAASQLARLKFGVKHASSRATVAKALAAMSAKTGISPDDLAEMSVPTFGLGSVGVRRIALGKFKGEMRVMNSREVKLEWSDEDGKLSVPAAIKKEFAEELKRFQREAKDASTMLAAQTLRLERSPLEDRHWPLEVWRKRFLDHPLLGSVVRRLIWKFDKTPAVPTEDGFTTVADGALTPKKESNVSLWHPIQSKPNEVLAWRRWLEQHELVQPFKQAHREIYVLTDAERRTKTYSNRFAGHILRQHQFTALCQQRGWEYRLQGEFDSHNVPTLHLPAQQMSVEFWADAVENDASHRGIYLYVATDQVRFGHDVAKVPPIVFSEVMRDVDLFVGVASVANDPTWHDTGPEGRLRTYWDNWSFGELSESAKSRKAILEALLPRLAESDRFALDGKFLVVRGNLRTYKIHLGSSNVLMEPNDQYLCIVPDRGAATKTSGQRLFLPFEGDTTLSVILSKALLLAKDEKIKEKSIVRQINS
jgi:hypothetical protein